MNKLLVALCIVLSGVAVFSNAKIRVSVNEDIFNSIIAKHIVTDPYVVVIEISSTSPQSGGYIHYLTSQDGFYFITSTSGKKKTFANPKIWVVPATSFAGHN